jgi:hypothetical protein
MEISRKVRPGVTRRMKDLHVGTPEDQSRNLLIEDENLQAMVTLYKYGGQVDLILTDPPDNTGQYFRYTDRWDEDPNDPELGTLVTLEDGSRHTKWMKAMLPRLHYARLGTARSGVIRAKADHDVLVQWLIAYRDASMPPHVRPHSSRSWRTEPVPPGYYCHRSRHYFVRAIAGRDVGARHVSRDRAVDRSHSSEVIWRE